MGLRDFAIGAARTSPILALQLWRWIRRRIMAVVIPFAPQRRPRQAFACSIPPRTAEILFLTGVRYERAPEARPAAAKTPAPGRARKVAVRKSARRQPA
jgi:predicted lipid-binding transport protein (Tim44 family)